MILIFQHVGKAWALRQRRMWDVMAEGRGEQQTAWRDVPATLHPWVPPTSCSPCTHPHTRHRSSLCSKTDALTLKNRPSFRAGNASFQTSQEERETNLWAQPKSVKQGLLEELTVQPNLHDVWAFLFQKSAQADCSRFPLPESLGWVQGNDLDCCRWVMDPLGGAWGVGEFTNYTHYSF